jgi:hypothetical protein
MTPARLNAEVEGLCARPDVFELIANKKPTRILQVNGAPNQVARGFLNLPSSRMLKNDLESLCEERSDEASKSNDSTMDFFINLLGASILRW